VCVSHLPYPLSSLLPALRQLPLSELRLNHRRCMLTNEHLQLWCTYTRLTSVGRPQLIYSYAHPLKPAPRSFLPGLTASTFTFSFPRFKQLFLIAILNYFQDFYSAVCGQGLRAGRHISPVSSQPPPTQLTHPTLLVFYLQHSPPCSLTLSTQVILKLTHSYLIQSSFLLSFPSSIHLIHCFIPNSTIIST
jgi:hypothetical protein